MKIRHADRATKHEASNAPWKRLATTLLLSLTWDEEHAAVSDADRQVDAVVRALAPVVQPRRRLRAGRVQPQSSYLKRCLRACTYVGGDYDDLEAKLSDWTQTGSCEQNCLIPDSALLRKALAATTGRQQRGCPLPSAEANGGRGACVRAPLRVLACAPACLRGFVRIRVRICGFRVRARARVRSPLFMCSPVQAKACSCVYQMHASMREVYATSARSCMHVHGPEGALACQSCLRCFGVCVAYVRAYVYPCIGRLPTQVCVKAMHRRVAKAVRVRALCVRTYVSE
eukprot:6186275-Pleurochrysis_carterae.AAC.3